MTSSPIGSKQITQIGLVVDDVEEAAAAWAALLGVEPPRVVTTDPVEVAHTVFRDEPTPARAKLAFFQLGQVTLELIEPLGEPSTWNDQLVDHGPSLHHIAFEVEGMDERLAALAEHGMVLEQRGDYEGGRYAYVEGRKRYGAVVELLEND
ncbi:MAG: VOC family protein [Anaerolineales bacterium]|nr:MAG: VOC family protein [Anaerolineales bacterium]